MLCTIRFGDTWVVLNKGRVVTGTSKEDARNQAEREASKRPSKKPETETVIDDNDND